MKKIKIMFASLMTAAAVFTAQLANAQCTITPLDSSGLDPRWQDLACAERGVAYNQVINVKNFGTVSGITVEYLEVDSIAPIYSGGVAQANTGLPSGLSWTMNVPAGNPANRLLTNENGCISVTGTTNAPAGQYRLGIYVCVKVSLSPTPFCGEAEQLVQTIGGLGGGGTLPSFEYYARVIEPGGVCDTTINVNEIENVKGLNVSPNPFSNNAKITFTADVAAKYTARLVDVMGKEVYSETLNATSGSNEFFLNRNNISTGVYFFTLTDGNAVSTKRIVIE